MLKSEIKKEKISQTCKENFFRTQPFAQPQQLMGPNFVFLSSNRTSVGQFRLHS